MFDAKIFTRACIVVHLLRAASDVAQGTDARGLAGTSPCNLLRDELVSGDSFIQADDEISSICAEKVTEEKVGSASMIQATPKRMKTMSSTTLDDIETSADAEVDDLETGTARRIHKHMDSPAQSTNNAKKASFAPSFFQTELVSSWSQQTSDIAWWQRPFVVGFGWICIVLMLVLVWKSSHKSWKMEGNSLYVDLDAVEADATYVIEAPMPEQLEGEGNVRDQAVITPAAIETDVASRDSAIKLEGHSASLEVDSRSQSSSDVFDNFVEQIANSVIEIGAKEKERRPPVHWWAPLEGSATQLG